VAGTNEIAAVQQSDFSVVAGRDNDRIIAKLVGTADQAAADALRETLTKIHAARAGVREAIIDLRGVEFMSSTCLKEVLTWINDIQELDTAEQYRVRFVSSPKFHWQKRSLHTVRCFAMELISIAYES